MKHIFPTYMAQNMHPHSRSGEERHSEEILDQNKTEKQPSRSMYSAWDFNFKGLGWLSPSSSVACDVNLSLRLVSLPQSALLGKCQRSDVSNISETSRQPRIHLHRSTRLSLGAFVLGLPWHMLSGPSDRQWLS